MEKEKSTTRKQKRKPAIVDTEIPGNWDLKNMTDFPRKERMIKNGTKADCLYSLGMNALVRGELEKGHDYLKEAYLLGDLNAGNTLAYGYSSGWFGYRDYDAFIQIIRKLAKKSYPTAMSNYAWAYENGIGVKRSFKWMKFWFLKAIDAGCMIAKSNLGIYYLFGNPKDRNEKEGVRLCFEAAIHGQEMAMNALGQCYEEGIVVTKNHTKAFKWYSMAVENGAGAYAEKNLARCYRFGIGVEVNMDKARKLIKVAMKHGYQPKNIQKTNELYGL